MTLTVANTILQQLGGQRFIVMTGARNLVSDANKERGALTMQVGKNANGVTHVCVTLRADDLYRVQTFKVRGFNITPLADVSGVYADNLRATFTEQTGLATSL